MGDVPVFSFWIGVISDKKISWKEKAKLKSPSMNLLGIWLTVKEEAGFTRDDRVKQPESKGIQTRMLFAGNLIKQPCFDEMRKSGEGYRVVNSPSHPPTLSSSALPVLDWSLSGDDGRDDRIYGWQDQRVFCQMKTLMTYSRGFRG